MIVADFLEKENDEEMWKGWSKGREYLELFI